MTITQTSGTPGQLDFEALDDRPTAAGSSAIADLGIYIQLTGPVRILSDHVEDGRRSARTRELDQRIAGKARHDVPTLLDELATDRGYAWSDIARLTGVTVAAVRKWRNDQPATPENRRALARLAAFTDLIDDSGLAGDPAGWLLMRLSEQHTVTAGDVYAAGNYEDLIEHLEGHLTVEGVLDRWNPEWRTATRSDWVVVDGPDGERLLTRRD